MKRNVNGAKRILILGASGFLGNALYHELLSYFDVRGTYYSSGEAFDDNQVFYQYSLEDHRLVDLLIDVAPSVVIWALDGEYSSQLSAQDQLCDYATVSGCQVIYMSSPYVFDGIFEFPSSETDRPMAESSYGRHQVAMEKLLKERLPGQYTILRLPYVLGVNSVWVTQLRQAIRHSAVFEVFPNRIVNATTLDKFVQQVHYIVNQGSTGIFHLGSQDVIHHEDLFREIASKLGDKMPIFKSVFTRNEDGYLAVLPKDNLLPETYRISLQEVIEDSTLKEEINTLKT